jgi:GNAT superfamily N-acetyltransferase
VNSLIRLAHVDDSESIARVHVESWRTTYKGIMPDELLASLSVEERAANRRRQLADPNHPAFVYVAEVDGEIVGFAGGGAERTGHDVYKGELYAIYLLQAFQGQGLGRMLTQAVARHLIGQGYNTMLIWVASQNSARHFYEAIGGKRIATKTESFGDAVIEETAYGYDDLKKLAGNS